MAKGLINNLLRVQNRMKQFVDRRRVDRELNVGDLVYLKLQSYRQQMVAVRRNLKLSSC